MIRLLPLLLLLSGCVDGCLEEPSEKRKFEIWAIAVHSNCVTGNSCNHTPQCHRESEARCVDAGYRPSCADEEVEGSCGTKVRP